jgi:hypothetical protein
MTLAASMSDVLSGSSLVMAVLAAFFTMWQSDISSASNAKVAPDPANRGPAKDLVNQVLRFKLVPLFVVTLIAFGVLIPRAAGLLAHTASCTTGLVHATECNYDDVGALLLLTEALLLGLVLMLLSQLQSVWAKRVALEA